MVYTNTTTVHSECNQQTQTDTCPGAATDCGLEWLLCSRNINTEHPKVKTARNIA